jgi:hypothetical protein
MWITHLFGTMWEFHPHLSLDAKALSTPEKQYQHIDLV